MGAINGILMGVYAVVMDPYKQIFPDLEVVHLKQFFLLKKFSSIMNRGSYTSDHFIWNLLNEPSASLINFIWNDHKWKIMFIIWLT